MCKSTVLDAYGSILTGSGLHLTGLRAFRSSSQDFCRQSFHKLLSSFDVSVSTDRSCRVCCLLALLEKPTCFGSTYPEGRSTYF